MGLIMSNKAPSIHVVRFWTDFKPDPKDPGKLKPVDKVAYGAVGQTQRSVVITEVMRLSQIIPHEDASNPAIQLARLRWDLIRPQYEAWKSGQEPPVEGTPLAAWNAIAPEQAEVLKARGVKTVEHIRDLTDASIEGLPVPYLRQLKQQAGHFLDSADAARFAAKLAEKDRTLQSQQEQINEQNALIRQLMEKVDQLATLAAERAETAPAEGELPMSAAAPKGKTRAA